MKKLLLLAAAALSMNMASAQWAVVGSYTNPNWNFDASTKFTGEGDDLSCEIEYLTSDFKIVDISDNNWDIQYGTATPVNINTPYVLDAKNGEAEPSNISFEGLIQAVKNATVKWNPTTATMEIVAQESDLVISYPTLYMTGSFCDWSTPGQDASVECTRNNDIYTVTVDLGTSVNVEFKLAGSGWSNEIAGGVTVTNDAAVKVTKGGTNLKTTLTGTQTLTFNYSTMLMTFGDPDLVNGDAADTAAWAVVGAYTDPNWNFEASTLLVKDGDVWTATIDYLTSDFKIVDITTGWDSQMGTSTPIEIGTTYTLEGKINGADAPNITFAGLVLAVKNAQIVWNPSTSELTVNAAETDIVKGYPTLYVTGSFCGWPSPGDGDSVLMTENEGIYTAQVTFSETQYNENGVIEFKIAGANWANEIAGGIEVGSQAVPVTKGGANLYTNLVGTMTLVLDYNEMTMYFEGGTVGVDSLESNMNAPVVYYNLQGMKVANPEKGIYIIRQGNKTAKVVL